MALANICNVTISSTVCMFLNADLVTNKKRSRASRRVMTLLIIVMFILSSVDYGSFWAYVRRAFIEHGETNQSTADSLEEYPNWFIGLTAAPDANAIIADGIMVRVSLRACISKSNCFRYGVVGSFGVRCGELFCYPYYAPPWPLVGPLPNLILSALMEITLAFSIVALYRSVNSTSFEGSGVDYATALYSTSLATTVYCTGMILYRLYCIVKIQGPGPGPGIRTYHGVMEILIESSALYCTATLFALIAYIKGGTPSEFAWVLWTSVTVSLSHLRKDVGRQLRFTIRELHPHSLLRAPLQSMPVLTSHGRIFLPESQGRRHFLTLRWWIPTLTISKMLVSRQRREQPLGQKMSKTWTIHRRGVKNERRLCRMKHEDSRYDKTLGDVPNEWCRSRTVRVYVIFIFSTFYLWHMCRGLINLFLAEEISSVER